MYKDPVNKEPGINGKYPGVLFVAHPSWTEPIPDDPWLFKQRLFQRSILQSSPKFKRPNGVGGGGCCCWWCCCCCHSWQWLVKNGECCFEMNPFSRELGGNFPSTRPVWQLSHEGHALRASDVPSFLAICFFTRPLWNQTGYPPPKILTCVRPGKIDDSKVWVSFLELPYFWGAPLRISGDISHTKNQKKNPSQVPLVHIWPQPWRKSVGPKSPVSRKSRTSPTITVASPEFSEARKSMYPAGN